MHAEAGLMDVAHCLPGRGTGVDHLGKGMLVDASQKMFVAAVCSLHMVQPTGAVSNASASIYLQVVTNCAGLSITIHMPMCSLSVQTLTCLPRGRINAVTLACVACEIQERRTHLLTSSCKEHCL